LTAISVALYSLYVNKMLMILPTTLLLGALGYLFYTSKRELSLDHDELIENQKENDDLYKDLEDLFI
jgi:cell division protein FtsL